MQLGLNAPAGGMTHTGPADRPEQQAFRWFSQPYAFIDSCLRTYGDTFTADVPGWGRPVLVVSEPSAVRQVFADRHAPLAPAAQFLAPVLGARSLFVLAGSRHLRERRALLSDLSGPALDHYGPAIRRAARRSISSWPTGSVFPLHEALLALSLEVVLHALFGAEAAHGERAALSTAVSRALGSISPGVAAAADGAENPAGRAFLEARDDLLRQIGQALHRRKTRSRALDRGLLENYLHRTVHDLPSIGWDMGQARAHALTLVFAGHETTAAALAWTLWLLHEHPHVLHGLRAELDSAGSSATPDQVASLPVLTSVVWESLRVRPVVPVVDRMTLDRWQIAGYEVPAGTHVSPCVYAAHQRPQAFEDALSFRPERFVGGHPSPFAYFPFGGGVRRCTGMAFALYSMKIILAEIVTSLEVVPHFARPIVPTRRTVIVAPSEGLPVSIERRRVP